MNTTFHGPEASGCVQDGPPFFSIIMNVYNGEKYLPEAIESVLAQTFARWELICWDDCSADRSADVCRQYSDERIRYYLAPTHTSVAEARNAAMQQARGQWLAFLDQDDFWEPTKLADQHALIAQKAGANLGIVYGRTMQVDRRGRKRDFDRWHEFSALPDGDIFQELIRRPCFVCLSSAALLRTAVEELGDIPKEVVYCPDYYLFVMVARNYSAAPLQDVCCWYRLHDANMSHKYTVQIHGEILSIIEGCSDRVDGATLSRRRRVHNTLVGLEEIRRKATFAKGVLRILGRGSLAYLFGRPWLYGFRSARRGMRSL